MTYKRGLYWIIKDRKGMFFTLITVLLLIPLIYFVTYYIGYSALEMKDLRDRTRCERLYYFVEDVDYDLERAMVIFGRRAAIYGISDIVTTGNDFSDYEFNCSVNCIYAQCDELEFSTAGAEAALAELIICGTLHGQPVPYMQNHTFPLWMEKMESSGRDMHFTLNISIRELELVPLNAWYFAIISTLDVRIMDEAELCYYEGSSTVLQSNTSIIGLEDPLYPLNTEGRYSKYFRNCTAQIEYDMIAGCSGSNRGSGVGSGTVVLYSEIGGNPGDIEAYCAATPPEVLAEQILVLDGGVPVCTQQLADCLNASSPAHFGGVLVYSPANNVQICEASIPWISDTGDIDDIVPENPPKETGCGAGNFTITNESCVIIKAIPGCSIWTVTLGLDSNLINTTCYQVSDIEENYNTFCVSNETNGPSFFDRLDGRLYLSEKYSDQARARFGDTTIGLESFVSPYIVNSYSLGVNDNSTWVDYLYWQNKSGCPATSTCKVGEYQFKLGCQHAYKYGINTDCEQAEGCCGDGTCDSGEDCLSCIEDCGLCFGEYCVNCSDEDGGGTPDWLDPKCDAAFDGCGTIKECDPLDTDTCNLCDAPIPDPLLSGDSSFCRYYGFNTSEWHFYRITPAVNGILGIEFNGTANVGTFRTDISLYNYTDQGCLNPDLTKYDGVGADYFIKTYCVRAGNQYHIGIDVDAQTCDFGNYTINVTVVPAIC